MLHLVFCQLLLGVKASFDTIRLRVRLSHSFKVLLCSVSIGVSETNYSSSGSAAANGNGDLIVAAVNDNPVIWWN